MSLGVQARDDLWESTMTKGTMGVGDESVHGNERSGYEKAKEALTKIHKEARKRARAKRARKRRAEEERRKKFDDRLER